VSNSIGCKAPRQLLTPPANFETALGSCPYIEATHEYGPTSARKARRRPRRSCEPGTAELITLTLNDYMFNLGLGRIKPDALSKRSAVVPVACVRVRLTDGVFRTGIEEPV